MITSIENRQPEAFFNVSVYAADPWYAALNGKIRNLVVGKLIEEKGKTNICKPCRLLSDRKNY